MSGANRRPWLAAAASLAVLASLLPGPPASAAPVPPGAPAQPAATTSPSAPPAPASSPPPPAPAQPPASSQVDASGLPRLQLHDKHFDPARSKQVPTLDPNVKQYDNPDGSHTLRIGLSPLVGLDASGARGDLDLSLTTGADGRLRPRRTMTPVSIAPASGADLATVELAPGKTVTLGADGVRSGVVAARTPGTPGGETVRYDAALPNGTSVELRPLSTGVETSYVVASAAAAAAVTESLRLPAGWTARQAGTSIDVLDERGQVVGTWAGGAATDSGPHAAAAHVTLRLTGVQGGRATAQVVVDAGWLADPKRVYPITIDPLTTRVSNPGATYVDTQDATSHWNGSELWLGTWNGGGEVARSLIQFPLTAIPAHARIVGATMSVDEMWSASCTPSSMDALQIGAVWSSGVAWGNQPGTVGNTVSSANVAYGFSPSCLESWVPMDLSGLVAAWYYGTAQNDGVELKASNETDSNSWKKFRGAGTSNPPLLDVTYETYGTSPIAVNDSDVQPPVAASNGAGYQGMTLTNQGSDDWPANGNYRVSYHLYKSDGTFLRDGPQTLIPQAVAHGGGTVTLRANIEANLPMGDYILAWDIVEVIGSTPVWMSSFGAFSPVNRQYHSDQPPTQAQLQSPQSGLHLVSETPTLTASSTDPDGPNLQFEFWICTGTDGQSGNCANSGWTGNSFWTVPRGVLTWGTTYYWTAWVRDNWPNPASVIGPPAPFSYTPTLPITQPSWAFGYDPYVSYDNGVNSALGNYVTRTTDFTIPTVGPPLQVVRTYNSMDTDAGMGLKPGGGTYGFGKWFGVGWSSTYETSLIFDQLGNAQVDYPDGRREFMIANGDGSYQPAFGFSASLTQIVVLSNGQSTIQYYDLHQHDQSVWRFTPDGRLFSMSDPQGHVVKLTWNNPNNDCCTSVVIADQTSGRSLTVNFSAPGDQTGRVTSIVSSPVTVNGTLQQLQWTYTYDGNKQLASACDPGGACTAYTNAGPGNLLTAVKRPAGNSQVTLTYDSSNRVATLMDGVGSVTGYGYASTSSTPCTTGSTSATPTETTTVTDALGHKVQSSYNCLNQLVQRVNEDGTARTYTFDQNGFLNSMTDENKHTTQYANDGSNNVITTIDGAGATTYRTFDAQNHLTAVRDPRSSSATDNTYLTTYTYDAASDRMSETTPAGTRTWAYSVGTEAAMGGGNMPPNLLLTATDAMGHSTTYAYDAQGNLRQRTDPSGLVTTFTYDELGRELSHTTVSDSYPNGLTATASYDLAGRTTVSTEPGVTNAVTGATHQLVTTMAYDGNGNLTSVTASDGTGGDVARKTTYGYDADDRRVSTTDPLGGTTSTTYDALGNVAQTTDALKRVTQTTYTVRNQPAQVTLLNFVDGGGHTRNLTQATYTYDGAGNKLTATDALGRVTRYAYDAANRLTTTTLSGYHNRDNTTRDVVLESRTYDAAGNVTGLAEGNGLRTTTDTYDPAGRLVTSAVGVSTGVTRTTTYAYDANGNVLSESVSQGGPTEQTTYHYDLDQAARRDQVQVVNGASNLVTSYRYDQRDLAVATVDPRGNVAGTSAAAYTTTYTYDQAGRLTTTTGPSVQAESGGSQPAAVQPVEAQGYDTFGDRTQSRDALGNVTASTFDATGRRTGTTYPTYVTPGGATVNAGESWTYDASGNVLTWTDRRGQVTSYAYDMRNLPVSQTDPKVSGQAAAGITTTGYDDVGNVTLVKDQVGAQQSFTYDDLNRMRTSARIVTVPGSSPPAAAVYTSTDDYDDLGNRTYQATPLGEVTQSQYDAMGELVQVTDPLGKVTKYVRDVAGRPVQVTDPLGRSTVSTYDLSGRLTQQQQTDASGAVLATTGSQYDAAGNLVAQTDPNGHTTTYAYDALSQLTQVTQPVSSTASVTTGFGYDAAGHQTRMTDGNGHSTVATYNAWGLPETQVLPSTQADPGLAARTWTWTYDAGGLPVTEAQPGVTVSTTYDELGRPVQKAGTTAAGTTTTSTSGYDLAGRKVSAGGTAGGETFTYDERGLMLSASGAGGSSSFTYDGDGRLVSRTDASGKTSFGYDARGGLTSVGEPLTGVQETLAYDAAGQLTSRGYGSGGATRTYAYDGLGQLTSDVMKSPGGAVALQAGYGYDAAGNLTQRTQTTPSGTGTDTYAYDFANRLTSWTDASGTATAYAWDGAGNRVQAGSQTYTYDERNRLLSGNGTTYTWSSNGDLLSTTNSSQATSVTYTYDGLDRLTSAQQTYLPPLSGGSTTTYSYDGLDRVVQRNGAAFTYAGTGQTPVTDGAFTYARGLNGEVLAVKNGSTPLLAAQDRHTDLTLTMDSGGNAQGLYSYDPFGAPIPRVTIGSSPPTPNLGFQGQWTDPTTGLELMGARWYDGQSGRFLSQDTYQPAQAAGADANLYQYGRANPLDYTDPSGHFQCWPETCIGLDFGQAIGQAIDQKIQQLWDKVTGRDRSTLRLDGSQGQYDEISPIDMQPPSDGGQGQDQAQTQSQEQGTQTQIPSWPPPPLPRPTGQRHLQAPPPNVNNGGGRTFLPQGLKIIWSGTGVLKSVTDQPQSPDACHDCGLLANATLGALATPPPFLPGGMGGGCGDPLQNALLGKVLPIPQGCKSDPETTRRYLEYLYENSGNISQATGVAALVIEPICEACGLALSVISFLTLMVATYRDCRSGDYTACALDSAGLVFGAVSLGFTRSGRTLMVGVGALRSSIEWSDFLAAAGLQPGFWSIALPWVNDHPHILEPPYHLPRPAPAPMPLRLGTDVQHWRGATP